MTETGVSHLPALLDENDLGDLKEEMLSQTEAAALENTVWRKLDRRILPLAAIFYLFAFVDRANIANARIAGLQHSLAISNYQYTLALTLTYIAFLIAEVPSTLFLKYVGPDLMLPAMTTLWGVVCAFQGLVTNYPGLLACRFFLGLLEGCLPPGIVLYLSLFYPRQRFQRRVTVHISFASLAGAFSGLLAAAIDQLEGKGSKPGWAWIFILEGACTIVFGVISFFLLPRAPERARFLTKKERAYVISMLKRAGSASQDDAQDDFSWIEVIRSVQSPHVWLISIAFFFSGMTVYGLSFFEPTIVAGLGYSGNQAQLMSVPPYAVGFVLSFTLAFVSDYYQCRGYAVIFSSFLQVIGFTMFYASTSNHVRYASLFFSVSGTFGAAPALGTWLVNNSSPHARRASAVAISFVLVELGAILATWLLGWLSPAPNYTTATITFISISIGMVLISAVNLAHVWRENRIKAERRQRMRKADEPAGLGDRSAWYIYSF